MKEEYEKAISPTGTMLFLSEMNWVFLITYTARGNGDDGWLAKQGNLGLANTSKKGVLVI